MQLTEVMEWLLTEGFVTVHKGKPKFTSHFQKAYNGVEKGLTLTGTVIEPGLPALAIASRVLLVATPAKFGIYKYEDWVQLYIQFIEEAKVPRRIVNNQGEPYATNKYSEDGMKAFQKALKAGAVYKTLVASVFLYYQGGTRLKKAIGNYMNHGDWRTDYLALLETAEEGKLDTHIKQEMKTHEHNQYRRG